MHCTFWASRLTVHLALFELLLSQATRSVFKEQQKWSVLYLLLSQVGCFSFFFSQSSLGRAGNKLRGKILSTALTAPTWTQIQTVCIRKGRTFLPSCHVPFSHEQQSEKKRSGLAYFVQLLVCSKRWHKNQQEGNLPGFCKISLFFAILLPYLGSFACRKGKGGEGERFKWIFFNSWNIGKQQSSETEVTCKLSLPRWPAQLFHLQQTISALSPDAHTLPGLVFCRGGEKKKSTIYSTILHLLQLKIKVVPC